jgi:uncharacterized protein (DUF433 family)
MTDATPFESPEITVALAMTEVLGYHYLTRQPEHWLRQVFFVGRPKLPVSRVIETMQANGQSVEEAACAWALPVAAIHEALDYYQRFRDLLEADAADELALSEALAQRLPEAP